MQGRCLLRVRRRELWWRMFWLVFIIIAHDMSVWRWNSWLALGAYPDLFVAGAAFSGVPYGCFAGSSNWNSPCADGKLVKTAAAWGDEARAGYPGYNGTRPRLQLWHGTADTTLYYQNFIEANKQCMPVHRVIRRLLIIIRARLIGYFFH
jgi:hypothetical protein